MYNVLVVDDSALMRKFVCDIINSIDGFSVSDVCADGETAYRYIKKKNYDAVTLSMIMPTVSGIDILRKLKEENITVPIIAISSSIREDRELASEALQLGAVDFVVRPLTVKSPQMEDFSVHLKRSLSTAILGKKSTVSIESFISSAAPLEKAEKPVVMKYEIVAIASSTGGPAALQVMVPMLSKLIEVPVVIVQHMPVGFTASLAERMDKHSKLSVKEGENGEVLKPGVVYIAPGGHQLKIGEDKSGKHILKITNDPPVNNLRPCADVMYESLVESSYKKILCVVLTGMGSDGARGIMALKGKKNISVITQNQESCVVYGMPKATYELGLSNAVCDIKDMANMIAKKLGV